MKRPMTPKVYLFDDLQTAHDAVTRLLARGVPADALGIITHDDAGHAVVDASLHGRVEPLDPIQTRTFSERAARNGARGAVVGGLFGMLGGLAALAIPGAGALLFLGSVGGAFAGGLLSALSTHVVHETEAVVFEEALRRGGTLVFAHDAAAERPDLGPLMVEAGATHLRARIARWRAEGWTGYTPPVEVVPPPAEPEPEIEDHFRHMDPDALDPWVQANWARLVGPIKAAWPSLSHDDLREIDGRRGALVARVHAIYGDSQDTVNWRLDELLAEVLGTPAIQDSPSAHLAAVSES
jgi:uncharacterized protein YjbJ (UPF0337 family)